MKRHLTVLIVLICLSLGQTFAQTTYVIYKVTGDVTMQKANGKAQVLPGDKLTQDTKLTIPFKGQVQVVDQVNSKRYILKNPGTGTLGSMMKDSQNSVSDLTKQYLEYMLAQVVDGGKSLRMEYSDVATVTREMQKTVAKKPKSDDGFDFDEDLEAEFAEFRFEVNREFESFRDSVNFVYAEFMKSGWKEFNSTPAIPKPNREEVKPVVLTKDSKPKTNFLWFRTKKKDVVEIPEPEPQPVPMAPIKEEPAVEEETPVSVDFYGTTATVRFRPSLKFTLPDVAPATLSEAWMTLSSNKYNNLIRDCIDIRFEKQLCDWAYLNLLMKIAETCLGEGNEATMLAAYIYCQTGYRMRLAQDVNTSKLYLMYASDFNIYDCNFYRIDNKNYYLFDKNKKAGRLSICNIPYPNEQLMSLMLTMPQKLEYEKTVPRTIIPEAHPDMKITVSVNKHLMDFYEGYPSSMINNNFMTRWAMYANTPLDENVKNQIYPVLREKIKGLSKVEAVNLLLSFLQTGFKYEYDEDVWGADRAFFAEETLYYSSCDCEDRAILLSRLIRDLVGVECALVYYPGHLAMGVSFGDETIEGTYYEYEGKRFYVCDPTIMGIGAPVGMPMEMFADCAEVSLILLENK